MYQTWIWHFHSVKILSCTRFLSTTLHYDPGAHHQAWNSCTLVSSTLCELNLLCLWPFYWNGELSRNIIFKFGWNEWVFLPFCNFSPHTLTWFCAIKIYRNAKLLTADLQQSYRGQECHGAPWVLAESTATAQFWFLFLWLAYELTEKITLHQITKCVIWCSNVSDISCVTLQLTQ